ncbi:hypothetical protein N7509_002143 [Penicillium cosmopolitanum]|uniref:LysM domain-containing protein n=1 Tax=Penicillium cosmopolitanum TaxID=1131564 RepID=A0A9W9W897_9EURO|nr:uncharacterized protein N7509_002143 [Penicillium cosmopolitanum]KAJ5408260.1 hypothetical protein N7509_002143 [Penicillium cosmopolitanum]
MTVSSYWRYILRCCYWVLMLFLDVFCQGMADEYGITLAELYKLNPALNGDCSGLWAGYAYCIGTPGLSTSVPATTTNTAPTATSSGNCANVTLPGPTQSGIPCTCNKYLMHDKDGQLPHCLLPN